jgi:hypothetical protein
MTTPAQRVAGWVRGYYADSWWTARPSPTGLALFTIAVFMTVFAVRVVLDAVGASPTHPGGMVAFAAGVILLGMPIVRWDGGAKSSTAFSPRSGNSPSIVY